jgi:hypothetical protein
METDTKLFVAFEDLVAVLNNSFVVWDITLCSPLKVSRCSNEHVASIF